MGSYTILRLRDDGDYDHVSINGDGTEEVIGVVAAAEKDVPWGRIPDAEQAEMMRVMRNDLLAETDWWASSDLTMTAEQSSYRQALRDITAHANWPHLSDSDWPTKP
jgi:hypothetical protein